MFTLYRSVSHSYTAWKLFRWLMTTIYIYSYIWFYMSTNLLLIRIKNKNRTTIHLSKVYPHVAFFNWCVSTPFRINSAELNSKTMDPPTPLSLNILKRIEINWIYHFFETFEYPSPPHISVTRNVPVRKACMQNKRLWSTWHSSSCNKMKGKSNLIEVICCDWADAVPSPLCLSSASRQRGNVISISICHRRWSRATARIYIATQRLRRHLQSMWIPIASPTLGRRFGHDGTRQMFFAAKNDLIVISIECRWI